MSGIKCAVKNRCPSLLLNHPKTAGKSLRSEEEEDEDADGDDDGRGCRRTKGEAFLDRREESANERAS